MVWGAYESTEPTPSIMMPVSGNCPPFPMAFSTWSRVLLVVDSLASSAGGITWENGGREPEEVKKTVSGCQARLTCWGMATLFLISELQF